MCRDERIARGEHLLLYLERRSRNQIGTRFQAIFQRRHRTHGGRFRDSVRRDASCRLFGKQLFSENNSANAQPFTPQAIGAEIRQGLQERDRAARRTTGRPSFGRHGFPPWPGRVIVRRHDPRNRCKMPGFQSLGDRGCKNRPLLARSLSIRRIGTGIVGRFRNAEQGKTDLR